MNTPAPYGVQAPDIDQRRPIGHCNYGRDVTVAIGRLIDSGQPMGPNYMGELMWPVVAMYDPTLGSTRVGFTLVQPADTP